MEDKYHTLIQQTEKVQAAHHQFENLTEIQTHVTEEIKYYLAEAIKAEKALVGAMKEQEEYVIAKKLEAKFEEMPQLESSFIN